MQYTASSASAFVSNVVSVNTHLGWSGTPYANLSQVEAAANYIGIHNFRDDPGNGAAITQAARDGFHFDLFSGGNVDSFVSFAHSLEAAVPGAIRALEGPNEVNGWPVSYGGLTGYAGANAYQKALFDKVNADPLLASKDVFGVTVAGQDDIPKLGDLSNATDYNSIHVYWGSGVPWWGWSQSDPKWHWTHWLDVGNDPAPSKPVVITETGVNTAYTTGAGAVNEAVQAKEILNAVMDAAKTGVSFLNIYELFDSRPPSATDTEANFGLYRWDGSAKPAANALHNFTTVLTDGHGTVSGGALDYTVSGLPASGAGGHFLFQEGDGTFDVVVWAEPDIWNESTRSEIAAPNSPVTLTFGASENVKVYDPISGATAIQTANGVTQITVNVTDHPLIVEVKPAGGSTPAPTPTPTPPPSTGGGGSSSGMTLTGKDSWASNLTGGAGADTLTAAHQADTLTGGGGADTFAYKVLPWSAGHVTDFTPGVDKLDLSALMQTYGYNGADPVADGRVAFWDDGAGGTKVLFDPDAAGSGQWSFAITDLDGVSSSGLTWAKLNDGGAASGGSTGGGAPAGGGSGGLTLAGNDASASTLTGGAGGDTLTAAHRPDVMTGGAGADDFVFQGLPWSAGHITDFTPGTDDLDLRPLFQSLGYTGADPLADKTLMLLADGQGGTQVLVDPSGSQWTYQLTTLDHVSPGQLTGADWIFH